jgi:choline dehydrogenase
LLLSGVGPPEQLEKLGIPVAAALSGVGENLQDHAAAPLRWTCPQPVSLDGTRTPWNSWQYRLRKRGPLASNLLEAGAYLKASRGAGECDLEILFAPLYALDRGLGGRAEQHGFTLLAALLTPKSSGRIRLTSADPMDAPRIDPGYLTAAEDRAGLKEIVERARDVVAAPAFAAYTGPASSGGDPIEELVVSLNHAVGSCRMGQDDNSVVDASLRVRGVAGLRVADASVMPVIPRAHPNATVMAIAEKAARLIYAE